ncbi:MAG: hypothetical protein O7E54_13705, partial [Planctomycetota bacterium]|nr:hypothetical protein [Planctomycetota bacterium]
GEDAGGVKEARMVPRDQAARAYTETTRRRVDPALVEWAGAGVFSARVFPLVPSRLHRIVIGYDIDLRRKGDALEFRLDLPRTGAKTRLDLSVADTGGEPVMASGAASALRRGRRY